MQVAGPTPQTVHSYASSLQLGPAGRVVLPVYVLASLLAWAAGGVALLFVALGLAVWAAALFHAFRQGRGIALQARAVPPHWTGEPFLFELELQARKGRGTQRDLLVCRGSQRRGRAASERPIGFLAQLAAGERVRLRCGHTHLQRGRLRELLVGIASTYPFGLLRVERHYVLPVQMMAWPRLGSWRGDLQPLARRNERQERSARQSGTDEFRQLNPWREGMNPRRIHWRQSERRGLWLVQELENRTSGPIELELLTATVRGRGGNGSRRASFETAVSLLATLVDHHLRRGATLNLRITGPAGSTSARYRGRTGRVAALDLLADVQSTEGDAATLEQLIDKATQRAPSQLIFAAGRGVRLPRQSARSSTQLLDVDAPDLDRHFRRSRSSGDEARGELAV